MLPYRQGEGKESRLHLWTGSVDWKMSMRKVREDSKEVEGAKEAQAECQGLVDTGNERWAIGGFSIRSMKCW